MTSTTYLDGGYLLGKDAEVSVTSPRKYWLRIFDAWDFLNDAAFDGEMVRPKIMVWEHLYCKDSKGRKVKLAGAYEPATSSIFLWWKGTHTLETLYHEMVHQYACEVLDADIGHGPLYWDNYYEGYAKINRYLKRKLHK